MFRFPAAPLMVGMLLSAAGLSSGPVAGAELHSQEKSLSEAIEYCKQLTGVPSDWLGIDPIKETPTEQEKARILERLREQQLMFGCVRKLLEQQIKPTPGFWDPCHSESSEPCVRFPK
jgi:hypothetical protein